MQRLFSSRVSITYFGDNFSFGEVDWPLGTLSFDHAGLSLGGTLFEYRLPWTEIDSLRPIWFGFAIEIEHHAVATPKYIRVAGFRLCRRLQAAVQQHQLPVSVSRQPPVA